MATLKPLPHRDLTQRQKLALEFGLGDRQLTRWIRFAESHCLDWVRLNRRLGLDSTPRHLHPFQHWVMTQILTYRRLGKEWIAPTLLEGELWSYAAWQNSLTDRMDATDDHHRTA